MFYLTWMGRFSINILMTISGNILYLKNMLKNIILPLVRQKKDLMKRYKMHEGTLNWTDLDFWAKELKLDILALKEQIKHLIEVHPHVEDFLKMLKAKNKQIFLVTNAHYKSIDH